MKNALAVASLASAIALVVVGMIIPPPGIVDETIIVIFAQLLIYSATMLGVEILIAKHKALFKQN